MNSFLCDIAREDKDKTVVMYHLNDNRCRYHRLKTKGKTKPMLGSFPCAITFCYLYPSLFSLQCQQSRAPYEQNPIEQRVRCAAQDHGLEFTLSYRKKPNTIINCFQKYLSRFINLFMPFEQRDLLIDYKVTKAQGDCPLGIKIGDTAFPWKKQMKYAQRLFIRYILLDNSWKINAWSDVLTIVRMSDIWQVNICQQIHLAYNVILIRSRYN